jgi:ligand-binding sensor domain-containing protein
MGLPLLGGFIQNARPLKLIYMCIFCSLRHIPVPGMQIFTPLRRSGKMIRRLLPAIFLFPLFSSAQKFHFQNYNVQQGLIQSQVIGITQDHYDNLWFCTLGGISRFDGKQFTNYSETDGLLSNFANTILASRDSNIYIGTVFGVSKFDGRSFKSIRFSDNPAGNVVKTLREDSLHRIWALAGGTLYRINLGEKPLHTVVSGLYERITAIDIDRQGFLWAAVMNKGVYRLEKDGWSLLIPLA